MQDKNSQLENNISYNYVDDLLATPPSRLVKYSNMALLTVILILFFISFFLQYKDGFHAVVTVRSLTSVIIKSDSKETTVFKIFVQEGARVRSGDTLILLTYQAGKIPIIAPISGKANPQRKFWPGDTIPAEVPLFHLVADYERYSIKIAMEAINLKKISIGQAVRIALDKYPKKEYGEFEAEIISLPYKEKNSSALVADAVFFNKSYIEPIKKLPPIIEESGTAFIITGNKRLLSKFFKF